MNGETKTCMSCGDEFSEQELDSHRENIGNDEVIINRWCPNCGELVSEELYQKGDSPLIGLEKLRKENAEKSVVLWEDESTAIRVIDYQSQSPGRGTIVLQDHYFVRDIMVFTYTTEAMKELLEDSVVDRAKGVSQGIMVQRMRTENYPSGKEI